VPLMVVSPEYTSQQCPIANCQHIDEKNRKTRDLFECMKCGYTEMADYVAAINIASRVPVNEPIVASVFTTVTSSHALAGSS
jgi:putative transposase